VDRAAIRVLVVDDDPWSQQVVASQLAPSGFRVGCAADGWEGLSLAGRAAPDLLVTEVRRPTIDAWSLAEELRGWAGLAKVPFIFVVDERSISIGNT
jgi:two-component system alkaline phosphatase synthesis response regulator PhoP